MPAANGVAKTPDLSVPQSLMRAFTPGRMLPSGLVIPKGAVPVTKLGFAVVPAAYGTPALLTAYQVKANWYAVICGLVLQFQGTGPAPGLGDVSYTVDIDRPLNDFTAGYTEKDYGSVQFALGTFVGGPPWPVEFRHSNGETIRVKGTPVANMGLGAGNFLIGCLLGFEWPQEGFEG